MSDWHIRVQQGCSHNFFDLPGGGYILNVVVPFASTSNLLVLTST
jgi:hypothetical protein